MKHCHSLAEALEDPLSVEGLSIDFHRGKDRRLPTGADYLKLKNLERLLFNSMPVRELPPELAKLKRLHLVSLHRCGQLARFPEVLSHLKKLDDLAIHRVKFRVPRDFRAPKLEALSLIELKLDAFTTFGARKLYKLELNLVGLRELPPEIAKLRKLQHLSLAGNRLTALPDEIGELRELDSLWLSGNPLTTLPDSIAKLSKLTALSLTKTKLQKSERTRIKALLPNTRIFW